MVMYTSRTVLIFRPIKESVPPRQSSILTWLQYLPLCQLLPPVGKFLSLIQRTIIKEQLLVAYLNTEKYYSECISETYAVSMRLKWCTHDIFFFRQIAEMGR
jgi:hypothetical protein